MAEVDPVEFRENKIVSVESACGTVELKKNVDVSKLNKFFLDAVYEYENFLSESCWSCRLTVGAGKH